MEKMPKKIKFDNELNYTLVYVKPLFVTKNYKFIFNAYSEDFRKNWTSRLNELNDRWGNELIVKFGVKSIVFGCLIQGDRKELAELIIKDIINTLSDYDLIISYGIGKVSHIYDNIHFCYGDVFVKVGRYLDKRKKKGIYFVE